MMSLKKIFAAIILMAPVIAFAANFKMTNETKYNLSFKSKNVCLDFVVIQPHSTILASFEDLCKGQKGSCMVSVYNTNNCKGFTAGVLTLNPARGVDNIMSSPNSGMSIEGDGFSLKFK